MVFLPERDNDLRFLLRRDVSGGIFVFLAEVIWIFLVLKDGAGYWSFVETSVWSLMNYESLTQLTEDKFMRLLIHNNNM